MALPADIRLSLLAPGFAAHPLKASYLEMAEELTAPASECSWNEQVRTQAVALRAAHLMTVALDPAYAGGVSSGPVSSKSEGDLSLSYGSSAGASSDADLSQTTFGRALLELGASNLLRVGVTGGSCVCR